MEIYVIVGYKDMSFNGNDGNSVAGRKYFYTSEEDNVVGQATGSFFLTTDKMAAVGFVPNVGDEVEAYYNRYGKISDLRAFR